MLYDIGLRITYTYQSPAAGGRQIVRLMPADLPGEQRLIAGHLEVTPAPAERIERLDFFGNRTTEFAFRDSYLTMEYKLSARIERIIGPNWLDMSPSLALLADEVSRQRSLLAQSPAHFIAPSARVPVVTEIADYARKLVAPEMQTVAAVRTIGEAIHDDMTFDPTATEVTTPIAEVFEQKRGVCQDYSHLMIACLRAVGIPSGYASGFLRTLPPEGQERLEGADAMHAWVRAWCGRDTGWIEYDPTNRMLADTDHIVVARGRDYADVAPIRGVLRTSGTQQSEQAVDVIPLEAA